jgi:hypothetical protein
MQPLKRNGTFLEPLSTFRVSICIAFFRLRFIVVELTLLSFVFTKKKKKKLHRSLCQSAGLKINLYVFAFYLD